MWQYYSLFPEKIQRSLSITNWPFRFMCSQTPFRFMWGQTLFRFIRDQTLFRFTCGLESIAKHVFCVVIHARRLRGFAIGRLSKKLGLPRHDFFVFDKSAERIWKLGRDFLIYPCQSSFNFFLFAVCWKKEFRETQFFLANYTFEKNIFVSTKGKLLLWRMGKVHITPCRHLSLSTFHNRLKVSCSSPRTNRIILSDKNSGAEYN